MVPRDNYLVGVTVVELQFLSVPDLQEIDRYEDVYKVLFVSRVLGSKYPSYPSGRNSCLGINIK